MKKLMILAAAAAMTFCACTGGTPGKVKVEGGWIEGSVSEGMAVYKGIPFAAPPVGDLRWKAPQPVVPWEGVLETKAFSKGPVQGGNPEEFGEDCLYLNVWTPAQSPKDKLPVLVWIYGGGFADGSSSFYDGEALARKGIILVSINYRVGWLGFLAHPELTAENPEGVSGNYGLLDQIAALKWVQNNIAQFGGDPSKVTIFGESAGGISVSMLCASPLAKGLFRGAISQSGGSFGPTRVTSYPGENMKTLEMAEADGVNYAGDLGASSIEELRALDVSAFTRPGPMTGGAWPIVDGYVIPDDQYRLYEAGKFNNVDILVGYNSDEGASFSRERDPQKHVSEVEERYGPFTQKLLEVYPVTETVVPKSGRDLMRDAAFGWHTWAWACLQAEKGGSNVFLYYFDQHPDYPEDSPMFGQGSPHGQDVAYVFQNPEEVLPTDRALSDIMGEYWANFTKYGDPNGEGLPEWPEFTRDSHRSMYLTGDKPFADAVPDEDALQVLDEYFRWRRTPEGAEWAK